MDLKAKYGVEKEMRRLLIASAVGLILTLIGLVTPAQTSDVLSKEISDKIKTGKQQESTYNPSPSSLDTGWVKLEPGLELGIFPSPIKSELSDSLIRVLRIDPRRFEFRLLNASAPGNVRPLTAKQWSRYNNLVAAINASMYQTDHRTSVALMCTKTHTNNPRLSKDKVILAFDRQSQNVPLAKIIDRQCEDLSIWRKNYGTLVQSIRMISCKNKNVWSQQPNKWSTAAIGTDSQGMVLFIHVRSPYSTHDLINILMEIPLKLSRAMYVEGGPEAQLYVRSGGKEYEFVGSYETGFNEDDSNTHACSIPNVVGIARRNILVK